MKRLQRDAVILSLIENLRSKGSWCGETHIQKATYFIQELLRVPLEFGSVTFFAETIHMNIPSYL